MGRRVGENAVEGADGGARRTGDNDGVGSGHFFLQTPGDPFFGCRRGLFLTFPNPKSNRKWACRSCAASWSCIVAAPGHPLLCSIKYSRTAQTAWNYDAFAHILEEGAIVTGSLL
jgi:hypothetical protein